MEDALMLQKRKSWFGLAFCSLIACSVMSQGFAQEDKPTTPQAIQAESKYKDREGFEVEIIGIAKITPEKVDCWDLKGKSLPSLADEIVTYLSRYHNVTFTVQSGMKNRYLVYRQSAGPQDSRWKVEGQERSQYGNWKNAQGQDIGMVWIAVEPSLKQVAPSVGLATKQGASIDMLFKLNQEFRINEYRYALDKVSELKLTDLPHRDEAQTYRGSSWSFHFNRTMDAQGDHWLTACVPLAVDKKPIEYVDLKGNPVSKKTFLSDPDNTDRFYQDGYVMGQDAKNDEKHRYMKVMLHLGSWGAKDVSLYSNVKPSSIGYIRFYYQTRYFVQFAPVPLDPKD
jgi:hypothetical protein